MDKQDTGRARMCMAAAMTAAAMLPGCAQPPASQPAAVQPPYVPVVQPALQPGCLLPHPQDVDTTQAGSVALQVEVSAAGVPVDVSAPGARSPSAAAFAEALRKCSFRPATRGGVPVAGVVSVSYSWRAGQRFVATSRCFPPNYPAVSRRLHETGKVVVLVRLPPGPGPVELQLQPTQAPARLVSHSIDAARSCLAHEEAREGMQRGAWYAAPYEWLLDPEDEPAAPGTPAS